MKTQLFVLFVVVVACNILCSAEQPDQNVRVGSYKAVTHYQYVITWAPTYCKYVHPKECVPNLAERFFMHGIWAGNSSGMTEDNCLDNKGPIPHGRLMAWQARLSRSWPSIIQKIPNLTFWVHEYKKHGVCFEGWSGDNYLSFADRVSVNSNITKILETNGIRKSTTQKYSRTAIEKAIQNKIGAGYNIYLGCVEEKVEKVFYLKDVVICIKKKKSTEYMNVYEFMSCPEKNDKYNNCGGGKNEEDNIILLSSV